MRMALMRWARDLSVLNIDRVYEGDVAFIGDGMHWHSAAHDIDAATREPWRNPCTGVGARQY
jgi:hypothetical protein